MGRSPCCSKEEGLNRGAWTAMEDKILTEYIRDHGEGKWRNLPKKAGLKRCGKSCRLRWLNYLRPDIKRGNITHDEEELIVRLHKLLGNRWSLIAGRLPGRTDNEIKNYWNTNIGKKIQGMTRTTSFSSNHKQPSKEKPNNPKPGQQFTASPPSPKTKPFVVRTKATRCAKFFISPELQNNLDHQIDTKPVVLGSPVAKELNDSNMDQSEPLVLFNSEEDKLSNFMIDDLDQVDDRFLSDLLNADFSEFCDFGENNGVEAENNYQPPSTAHESSPYSSPNSEQTLLFSEDNLDDPCDLQSMASLLDSQLDWI